MSDIKGTIYKVTKNVTTTSGNLIKTAKLSINLTNEQEILKGIYIEIGKRVHEIYTHGGSLGGYFDEKYTEIVRTTEKIENIKEKINVVKGTRICPKCGKPTVRTAEFCPKCGADLNDDADETEYGYEIETEHEYENEHKALSKPHAPPVPEEHTQASNIKCRTCGADNGTDTKFCLSCGRIL
ncbi:MAG: zinc-ribbon domain-containing protein [Defluviitaleaceae bacterium]|nr:zinc-ribbon domain-containing protein [Defluviitaleaceae bacterium]